MKKLFYALMALVMGCGMAQAQKVKVIGLDGKTIATYKLDEVEQLVFLSADSEEEIEAVDLGLSVKWANKNVGAEKSSDYGDYFAWGETAPKASYTIDNSKWYGADYTELKTKGVIDANGNLTSQYDSATANWGGSWRMPTYNEIDELIHKCVWSWTTENGNKGFVVTGSTGNSIFLPATGYRDGDDLNHAGSNGYYWSSRAHNEEEELSYNLFLSSWAIFLDFNARYYGLSVRPVTE